MSLAADATGLLPRGPRIRQSPYAMDECRTPPKDFTRKSLLRHRVDTHGFCPGTCEIQHCAGHLEPGQGGSRDPGGGGRGDWVVSPAVRHTETWNSLPSGD